MAEAGVSSMNPTDAWARPGAALALVGGLALALSGLCRFAMAASATRLHCAIAGHDDSFVREAGRLSLRCEDCGRRTPGWTIGSGGPRVTSRLPGCSRATVPFGTGVSQASWRRDTHPRDWRTVRASSFDRGLKKK
jgi:hypothetical protein